MSVQRMATTDLIDMIEQSLTQMRSGDTVEELSGLNAARMFVSELRRRVVDSGNIAGNATGDIDGYPELPRERRLEQLLETFGVQDSTPESVRTTVAALLDRADAGDLTVGDQELLDLHARIAATVVRAYTSGASLGRDIDDAVRRPTPSSSRTRISG